jgi:hypothetical protein
MITIQVNGSPTTGTIAILENNSALATTVTPLKSFMSADMVDDGMATFPSVVSSTDSAVSGTNSYDFNTLSVDDTNILQFAVYPNPVPANDTEINIQWNHNSQKVTIDLLDVQGRLVHTYEQFMLDNGANTVRLPSVGNGLYLLEINTHSETLTKKIIIK